MSAQRQPLASDAARGGRVDVDFSLAIHNRTGKYFIGRDLLDTADLPVGNVHYWRVAAARPPTGLLGRVIGRLQLLHVQGQALGGPLRLLPRRRSPRPLLHLDPFTVPTTVLRPIDAVLCHDVGPLSHPELFDAHVCRLYRPIYDEIARIGPHLIFVSEASRRAFAQLYPDATPTSTRVIYPAIRSGLAGTPAAPVPGVESPFLLTVGSLGDRKNQLRCIAAFARSGLAARGVDYVLCGAREPGFEAVIAAAEATPGVICLPYVSDAELSWLYAHAAGFVLVSLLEGFGMPVAEAIDRGLVPLVSRDSVLHEVAGGGALLADPEDVDEIASAMTALATMTQEQRSQRYVSLRQASQRFELVKIRDDWRAAFAEIVQAAATA
ncbi:MAG: hypothetical protein B7Z33_08120 [Sphingomonadales bacterium 12-68-11]|nr:MAG: hypothetical protein B7Z33_08120 [Sphingomonadales bacterium 12-68-11]